MQNAYRSGPTLETIPAEMKLMIASHLDPDVSLDLRWSEMARGEARIRRAALESLSLVSRSWAAALAELKWQTLHLRVTNTDRLLELARDDMPRYGAKVKKLVLVWWTFDDLSELWYRFDLPSNRQLEALVVSERFIGLNEASDQPLQRVFDVHDALIATILQACANLRHFKVVDRRTTRYFMGKEGSTISISSSRTENALQELGGRISSTDFSSVDSFFGHDGVTAIKHLDIFANVEHLSVRIDVKHSALDVPELLRKLPRWKKLVSLELANISFRAVRTMSARPCRTLTQLTLSEMTDLQVTELANILKVHPITSLRLRDLSISGFQYPHSLSAPRPGSIKVKNLSIGGRTDGALLDLFDAAPLKHVEFCARRGGRNSARFSSQRIKAFIKKHHTSLLSFKADRVFFDAAEVSAINRSLEQEGVSVRVVTVE